MEEATSGVELAELACITAPLSQMGETGSTVSLSHSLDVPQLVSGRAEPATLVVRGKEEVKDGGSTTTNQALRESFCLDFPVLRTNL